MAFPAGHVAARRARSATTTPTSSTRPTRHRADGRRDRDQPLHARLRLAAGPLPVSLEALMRAIEFNGAAIEMNKTAFAWGRLAAHDMSRVRSVLQFKSRASTPTKSAAGAAVSRARARGRCAGSPTPSPGPCHERDASTPAYPRALHGPVLLARRQRDRAHRHPDHRPIETGSPLAAGVAGVFATVPLVIGGTFGGVLVDRFGYRVSSIVADVASGLTVIAIPLLSATVGLSFGVLLALVFLGGLLDPPGDTAKTVARARPRALARMPLARAAGAQSAVQRTSTMVGAGVAGALVALFGPVPALIVDAGDSSSRRVLVACFVPRAVAAAADRTPRSGTSTRRAASSPASASSRGIRCCGPSCCSSRSRTPSTPPG